MLEAVDGQNSDLCNEFSPQAPAGGQDDMVVVGAGPTGAFLARVLHAQGQRVVLLNDEPWRPYNRVLLTPLLAGEVPLGRVVSDPGAVAGGAAVYTGVRVTGIDRDAQVVETSTGRMFGYSKLVLCLGSRPFVPPIVGADAGNVFTFRSAQDVAALKARSFSARKVVVIGGGLLGLEAARGMAALGAEVTVVEHEARLMPRQLDEAGSQELARAIGALGVVSATGVRVERIESFQGRVSAVVMADGALHRADTVVICTGVRPNAGLARDAGLTVNRGIVVSRQMQTSDPNIFAAGECVECAGEIEGLVGPCLEQARVAAAAIVGGEEKYTRAPVATKLKVVGVDVFSMGPVEALSAATTARSRAWRDTAQGLYRKIFLARDGRLLGAVAVGAWPEASRIQETILDGGALSRLAAWRFARSGSLWKDGGVSDPADWPVTAVVCNCTGVTKGQILAAKAEGPPVLEAIRARTGASSVCGTCQPIVEELLNAGGAPQPMRWSKAVTVFSALAAALALIVALAPPIPFAGSFARAGLFEDLWLDNITKQWTGFTLLGLTVLAALIGLRKRIRLFDRLGGYDWWRTAHLILGGITGVALFAHTGFRFGGNLTMALMAFFVATLIVGAIAGLATGQDHKLRAAGYGKATRPPRRLPTWVHIVLLWPIPLLLAAHILAVYAY